MRYLRLPARPKKTWPSGESHRRDWLRRVPSPIEGRSSLQVAAHWLSNCLGLRGMVRAAASTTCLRRPPSHENRLRSSRNHTKNAQIYASVLTFREACKAGVLRRQAFVSRASDADRRSRRRENDGRRSQNRSNLPEAKGSELRPSSHGVDASSQAASASRQMSRAFVVRAGRRKRPFHLPNASNMRISQCFQGYGLHRRPKTGDIPAKSAAGPSEHLGLYTSFHFLCTPSLPLCVSARVIQLTSMGSLSLRFSGCFSDFRQLAKRILPVDGICFVG